MILILISFVGGVLTVLAPCILPLLPVIIGGSLTSGVNRAKVFRIIGSLGVSVIAFTLLLKASTLLIDIPQSAWQWVSGSIIILLGIVTLFPSLWESEALAKMSGRFNQMLGRGSMKDNAGGDILMGVALGPVFSTCSPTYFIVIATVLPAQPIVGLLYLLAYTTGLCLSLLAISLIGQRIVGKLGVAADSRGWFKRVLAIIFILVGIAIIGGLDKKSQIWILDNGFFDVTQIEQKLLELR